MKGGNHTILQQTRLLAWSVVTLKDGGDINIYMKRYEQIAYLTGYSFTNELFVDDFKRGGVGMMISDAIKVCIIVAGHGEFRELRNGRRDAGK